jgi:hypothetical protein
MMGGGVIFTGFMLNFYCNNWTSGVHCGFAQGLGIESHHFALQLV